MSLTPERIPGNMEELARRVWGCTDIDSAVAIISAYCAHHAEALRKRAEEAEEYGRKNSDAVLGFQDRALRAEARVAELERVIEHDRSLLSAHVIVLETEIACRTWLIEGRGGYGWNDDRYRKEFSDALAAITGTMGPLKRLAADLSNSPKTSEEVRQAREDKDARIAELEKKVAYFDQLQADASLRAARETALRLEAEAKLAGMKILESQREWDCGICCGPTDPEFCGPGQCHGRRP